MTESERVLWEGLRKLNCGYHFRRQHPIDYIADFACLKKKLVIEVDGGYHNEPLQQQNDQMRTGFLESKGYDAVIRFKNEEISSDFHTVITRIKEILFNE